MSQIRNYIYHIAVLVDASSSMDGQQANVIKAVDGYVKYLAKRSVEMDQETRISVYTFADAYNIKCIIFDKDVMRLPSIADFYHVHGNTALIDATLLSIRDLKLTCTKYGEHAFLVVAFTDGEENNSRERWTYDANSVRHPTLKLEVEKLPDNWTVAAMVPGFSARQEALDWGFPKDNVQAWDTMSKTGVEDAIEVMAKATDSYMVTNTTSGLTKRGFFSTDASAVNAATIKAAKLQPLVTGTYDLVAVAKIKPGEGTLNKDKKPCWEIKAFLEHNGLKFVLGRNFYKMTKQELIAGDKELAIREKSTNKVYVGAGVRDMIGLSDQKQRVAPDKNPEYDIFVQSKSNNRYLFHGDEILVLK